MIKEKEVMKVENDDDFDEYDDILTEEEKKFVEEAYYKSVNGLVNRDSEDDFVKHLDDDDSED